MNDIIFIENINYKKKKSNQWHCHQHSFLFIYFWYRYLPVKRKKVPAFTDLITAGTFFLTTKYNKFVTGNLFLPCQNVSVFTEYR